MTGRWKAASLLPSFARRAIQDRASQAYVQTDALPACQYLCPFAAQAHPSPTSGGTKKTPRAPYIGRPSFNKSLFVSKRITGPQVTTTAPWPWLDPNRPYVPPVLLEPKGSQLQLPDAVEAVKANISLRAAELAKNTGRSPDRCLVPRSSETVEVIINTLTDPKLSDHMVRGTVTLPHSIGKVARVAVFAKDAQVARAALEAGADVVGGEELVQAIVESGGDSIDFDTAFTTPDFMKALVKAGKVLGPRGLMPNPKMGTLTLDIAGAVKAVKAGRMEFKVTKERVLHSVLGKATAPSTHLKENCQTLVKALLQHRPASLPGRELEGYIASIYLKSAQTSPVRVAPDSCLP
ncbi:ribosomal protein L1-like protein [Haematococcus lacustris]